MNRRKLMPNMPITDIIEIMSDGNKDAKKLFESVFYNAGSIDKDAVNAWKKNTDASMSPYFTVGQIYLLSLDDMNIRGDYVQSAYEYCGNNMQTFIKKINDRDAQMIDYVNQKAVENAMDNGIFCVPRATQYGASYDNFKQPNIFRDEYNSYLKDIQSVGVDYSLQEIYNDISTDEALKIFKSNGFEMVYNEVCKGTKLSYSDGDERCIIMQNPDTGAIMCANHAISENICYGGCEITMPTKLSRTSVFTASDDFVECNNIDGHENINVCHMTYDSNMMKKYRSLCNHSKESDFVKDSTVLGYSGLRNIELPRAESYNNGFIMHRDFKYPKFKYLNQNGEGYTFDRIITCLNMDNAIKDVKPDKKWLYQPFFDNRYSETMNRCYFGNDVRTNSLLFGAAFKMYGVSKNEIDKYYDAAEGSLGKQFDELKKENLKALKRNRNLFYGESDITKKFLDEFNLKPAESFDDNVKKRRQQRTAMAEALCSDISEPNNDYQYD